MYKGLYRNIDNYNDWILLVSIVSLLLIIIAYYLKPNLFFRIIRAGFNPVETEKIKDEKNKLISRISFYLNLSFIINLSLFAFISLKNFGLRDDKWYFLLLIIAGFVLSYYLLRFFIYIIAGWITDSYELQMNYVSAWMSLNKIYGILLIPGLFFLLYNSYTGFSKYLIYFYLSLFACLYILKIYRGIKLAGEKRISVHHIFLYFCTLEIIPVSVIIKHGGEII